MVILLILLGLFLCLNLFFLILIAVINDTNFYELLSFSIIVIILFPFWIIPFLIYRFYDYVQEM